MNTSVRPQPLDYRSPGTPWAGGDLLFRWLCTRHCLGVAGAIAGIAAGVAVVLVGGVVVSGAVAWMVERLTTASDSLAFWITLAAYLAIVVPLLIRSVMRQGGDFYTQQVVSSDLYHGTPSSYGEWAYRGDVATTALYVDLLFWGPRLIVDGSRRLAGRDIVRSAATLRRATHILDHLLRAGDAVRTKALRFPQEPMQDFERVLRWLDARDYIGISSDRQRVWLSSQTRETLNLLLKPGPRPRSRRPITGWGASKLVDNSKSVGMIFRP